MLKPFIALLIALAAFAAPVEARTRGSTTGRYVHVNGYVRANGHYVQSYWRAAPGTAIGGSHATRLTASYRALTSGPLDSAAPTNEAVQQEGEQGLVTAVSYPAEGYPEADLSKPAVINQASLAWCPQGKIVGAGYGVCEIN